MKSLGPRVRQLDMRTAQPPAKRADPFYLTPEWRALVANIKAQRGNRCEECGGTDCRIIGDHVIEISDGGPLLDPAGIKLLCHSCHGIKTAVERARRTRKRHQAVSP